MQCLGGFPLRLWGQVWAMGQVWVHPLAHCECQRESFVAGREIVLIVEFQSENNTKIEEGELEKDRDSEWPLAFSIRLNMVKVGQERQR